MEKVPAVYMMANKKNGTIYTGVTSNLISRYYKHKNKLIKGFTHTYNCTKLVYYEIHGTMNGAIEREKQLKSGSRKKKIILINNQNPLWNDLGKNLLL